MAQVWDDILKMLAAPFVGDLDLWHLFLLVGVVIVFAAAWAFLLNHIRLAELEI